MSKTSIEWTDFSWSPLRARVKDDAAEIARAKGYTSLVQIAERMAGHIGQHCEHVSDGCKLCYSETNQARCLPNNGTGLPFDRRSRDLIDPIVDEKILFQPLHWKKPRLVFVENQSDLFGEWVTDEAIDRVFAVMGLTPHITYQVLTKRERMLAYFGDLAYRQEVIGINAELLSGLDRHFDGPGTTPGYGVTWRLPFPNVWLGVSVEDQKTADERIPLLLQTPAAIRFVSYEPALGPVDFTALPSRSGIGRYLDALSNAGVDPGALIPNRLNWVITGGESGPNARPFDIALARSVIQQCRDAGVACFVKQLGADPREYCCDGSHPKMNLRDPKGGDMSEWPEDLRVREFPSVASQPIGERPL